MVQDELHNNNINILITSQGYDSCYGWGWVGEWDTCLMQFWLWVGYVCYSTVT